MRCSLLLRTRQPKFLHRPKRLRCDSDPEAGAATPQIAPPTRAPAGRRPTDARHSRNARSRSHHGHRSATVTPESLQAAGKLPCATSPRHCRLSTPPSSRDGGVECLLRSLRGARQRARLYTSTDSLSNDGGPGSEYADCADCGPRFPPLRPHVRRDVQLGFRRRLRRRRPRLGFRPARADSMWDRTIVSCAMCMW